MPKLDLSKHKKSCIGVTYFLFQLIMSKVILSKKNQHFIIFKSIKNLFVVKNLSTNTQLECLWRLGCTCTHTCCTLIINAKYEYILISTIRIHTTLLRWWALFMDHAIGSRNKPSDVEIPILWTKSEARIAKHNSSTEQCYVNMWYVRCDF